jgi:hypothetical protein
MGSIVNSLLKGAAQCLNQLAEENEAQSTKKSRKKTNKTSREPSGEFAGLPKGTRYSLTPSYQGQAPVFHLQGNHGLREGEHFSFEPSTKKQKPAFWIVPQSTQLPHPPMHTASATPVDYTAPTRSVEPPAQARSPQAVLDNLVNSMMGIVHSEAQNAKTQYERDHGSAGLISFINNALDRKDLSEEVIDTLLVMASSLSSQLPDVNTAPAQNATTNPLPHRTSSPVPNPRAAPATIDAGMSKAKQAVTQLVKQFWENATTLGGSEEEWRHLEDALNQLEIPEDELAGHMQFFYDTQGASLVSAWVKENPQGDQPYEKYIEQSQASFKEKFETAQNGAKKALYSHIVENLPHIIRQNKIDELLAAWSTEYPLGGELDDEQYFQQAIAHFEEKLNKATTENEKCLFESLLSQLEEDLISAGDLADFLGPDNR